MPYPTGDLNQDGIVDSIDLSILVSNWGTDDPASDLNNDGVVNSIDLSLLVGNWGAEGSSEPSSPDDITINHGKDLLTSHVGLEAWGLEFSDLDPAPSNTIETTHDGQIIEGYDFAGSTSAPTIRVMHNNCIIRKNRIRFPTPSNGVSIDSSVSGTLVEYNYLDGVDAPDGNFGCIGITGGVGGLFRRNYGTRVRVMVTGCRNDTHVIENWCNDFLAGGGSHHNSFSYHGAGTGEGYQHLRNRARAGNSGGISFYARNGSLKNCESRDNLIVGFGSGFGMYGGFLNAGSSTNWHHLNENIELTGNRFTGTFGWPEVLGESTNAAMNLGQPGMVFSDNRWLNDDPHGNELPARCGVSQNACQSDWTTG